MIGDYPGSKARYLSLALFSQRMIDYLTEFLAEDNSESMTSCAQEALKFSRTLSGEQISGEELTESFNSYEQVRTFEKAVESEAAIERILRLLIELQNPSGNKDQKREKAKAAIDFFGILEKRALLNYGNPVDPLPQGIRDLCQTP